jgi:hypothetical protein
MNLSKADLESAVLEGTKVTVRLPRKQSALLRLAVRDAMLLEKDPRYKSNMMTWAGASPTRPPECRRPRA